MISLPKLMQRMFNSTDNKSHLSLTPLLQHVPKSYSDTR
uniref:Uncharacterized protein n=1 Tax=Arundo donax TaxID=35708 RepID=A0A0A9G2V6_ARUDO